jgi:hypothetical protein
MFKVIEITLRKFVIFFENPKKTTHNLKCSKSITATLLSVILILSLNIRANSQDREGLPKDSIRSKTNILEGTLDSLANNIIQYADSVRLDSLEQQPVGDIKTTVKYNATDSITLDMFTKDVQLFGKAKIDYDPVGIEAERITVNWEKSEMQAKGGVDTTGVEIGTPVFTNGSETYETEDIKYNFKTDKAAIKGLVTQQGDGFIHADLVFKNEKGELFNRTTLYTTCNLAHPHYSIKARKVKIIPGKEMITGPFNMVINDVPTPLGWAFGIFPDQQKRTSGIVVPTFGEETLRGFYLKDGGYYFAFNDYINLELTGDIYTIGGWAIKARSSYLKRYGFRGNLLFNFNKFKQENATTLETTVSNDFRLSWSHTPESKGTGRFSANVNIATSSYSDNNVLANQDDQIRATLSSNINYSKTFSGTPLSFSLAGRFNQNLKTNEADILLPEFIFNVQNVYPLKRKSGSSNRWYEKIVFRYGMNATNKIKNILIIDGKDSTVELNSSTLPLLIANGSNGFRHDIPISTTFNLLKHFTLSPSLQYQELWYFKKLDYSFDPETTKIVTDTIQGFNAVRSYSASLSLNTRIFGTAFFKNEYGVQAIRHQMTPALSFSYKPDFGEPKYDYYQEVQSDSLGNTRTLSRYAGFVYGSPTRGENGSIGLSITNNLEMKVRSRKDTTNKAKKVILLRNFGVATAYNIVADSFNLGNISLRATTSLFSNQDLGQSASMDPLNINFNGTIDPYIYQLDSIYLDKNGNEKVAQRRLNQFAFNNGQGLGQFSRFNISISTGFKAKTKKKSTGGSRAVRGGAMQTGSSKDLSELREYELNPEYYIDFKIPWSIRFTYNVNYARAGFREGKITQSLRFNGDLSLTEKWKVTFNSGYDFQQDKFTEARLSIVRDLHCWEMTLGWVPYGRYQSYNFTIRAKSSLLQDLKISKRRNATDSFSF